MGTWKEMRRLRCEAITKSITEVSGAIQKAREKEDYKAVADMTNALTALLVAYEEAY